jgi:flagellar motor switch protein FliG
MAMPLAAEQSPDMMLLEQESKFEREKTEYLQQNVLDKILGQGKAVVVVDVDMGLESRAADMSMGKSKSDKKKNEDDGSAPIPAQKMLVPGVPMPKSVNQVEEDRGGSAQVAGGVMQQKKLDVRITIKKLKVTVLYDKRVHSDKLLAVKQAVVALLKVTEQQMEFTPTSFTETAWEQVLTPKWIIPVALALWLLLFLWGPVAGFFRRLTRALEDKSQQITQTMSMKQQSESNEQAEEEGAGGGGGGAGGEGGELTEEEKKEGEEEMKKFEPFKYVSEENLKRLAYLIRKEEPWIIALVLSYLKPEFAKEVLASMPPELQARVAIETATIRQTSLEQVMSIDEYIKKKIDFVLGGLENLLKIMDEADKTTRETILEYLKNEKPQLYERVREEVVMFEDLLKFPDGAIQVIVREVGTESLARALKNASPDYMNKFFMNMSAGAAALLKESMDYGRPLTPEQIDEERKKLMDVISKAERDGKINFRKRRKMSMLEGEEAADDSESLQLGKSKPAATPAADPQQAAQYFQTGLEQYQQGLYAEALQSFHYSLQAQPNQWQVYQYLGATYYAQGMTTQAMGAYERMLELNPNDAGLRDWVNQFKAQNGAAR